MIKFGVAGIPLTSKGRTYIDSIEDVANLGLNSLEVQLLRVNVSEDPAIEYVDMYPKDVTDGVVEKPDVVGANNGDNNECRSKHNEICYQGKDSN